MKNVALPVAVGVNQMGMREALAVEEGAKEDTASWRRFLSGMKARGLATPRLIVGDRCLGLIEALGETFPESRYQRCTARGLEPLTFSLKG